MSRRGGVLQGWSHRRNSHYANQWREGWACAARERCCERVGALGVTHGAPPQVECEPPDRGPVGAAHSGRARGEGVLGVAAVWDSAVALTG